MGDLKDWSQTMELHLRSVKAELEHSGVRPGWQGLHCETEWRFFLYITSTHSETCRNYCRSSTRYTAGALQSKAVVLQGNTTAL